MIQDRLQFPERKAIAIHCHPELSSFCFSLFKVLYEESFPTKKSRPKRTATLLGMQFQGVMEQWGFASMGVPQ
jgi:hypothetical protein